MPNSQNNTEIFNKPTNIPKHLRNIWIEDADLNSLFAELIKATTLEEVENAINDAFEGPSFLENL